MKTFFLSRSSRCAARIALAAAIFAPATGCASALDLHTLTSPTAHFDRYRSFAFDSSLVAPENFAASPHSPEVRKEIEERAAAILEGRGYTRANGARADLLLRVETGRRQTTTGEPMALPPETESHIPFSSAPLDDERHDLVEGAFVIDAFDGETHQMLWHGSVREAVDPAHVDFERLRHAVEKVMATFPARTAS